MTDITIPREARQAAWEAFVDASINENLSSEECLHAACIAMLKAWPGMSIEKFAPWSKDKTIHLPFPHKETSDEHDGQPDEAQEWRDYDPDC